MKSNVFLRAPALFVLASVSCFPGDGRGGSEASEPGVPAETSDPDARAHPLDSHPPRNFGENLQGLGEEVYSTGQIDSARALFEGALVEARASKDSAGVARALTWLAQASWRLGEYEETRRIGEEALALKLRFGLEDELFRSYNVLGLLAWNQSRLLDATRLLGQAAEVATAARDSVNLAKVRNNLALVHTSVGRFEEARRGFLAARSLARDVGDPLIEGRVLINLAMLATEVGDAQAATLRIQEARPLLRAAEDPIGELSALGHLGTAYAAIGQLGRAVACLDSALHWAREQGLRQEEASNLGQLAELHRDAGNLRRALELLDASGEVNAELGLGDELATVRINQAKIRADLGNPALAMENALEALAIHREIGSRLREIEDLVVLAELCQEMGRLGEARGYLNDAEQVLTHLNARTGRMAVALGRARMAEEGEEFQEVLRILGEAETDLEGGGYDIEWEAHALRSKAYAGLGMLDSAAEEGRRAISAVERVRGTFSSGMLRDSYLRERAATYSDQVLVLLESGRVEEAFRTSDAARGRALLERISAFGEAGEEPDPGLVNRLAEGDRNLRRIVELTRTLEEMQEVGLSEGGDRDLEGEMALLFRELEDLRSEYSAALVRAEEHDPRGMALLGGGTTDVDGVRGALEPGEALLEFMVLPEKVLLFLVTESGIRVFETEVSRERLAGRIRVARGAVRERDAGTDAGRAALERLYESLLGPAVEAGALSEIQRLIIVPHAELSYLPFAALRNPDTDQYLIEAFLIRHLPNASAVPAFRNRETRGRGPGVQTISAFAPLPRTLPGTVSELEAIREAMGSVLLFQAERATEGRFREALKNAALVHAATHGVMNARNPMFSRIEMAPGAEHEIPEGPASAFFAETDGRLEVHELLGLPIGASLVFLSGCETALGPGWSTGFGRGEEFATLAQAFLHAGAESVIATLWRIDDPGAAAFAGRFYLELSRTGSSAEALAATQRAFLEDPEYGSPFYWAPYRLMGTGGRLFDARTTTSVRLRDMKAGAPFAF